MPAPHVAPARRQLPLGVRTKRACARRRGGCWASRSRLCATWQRRPSRSRTAATRRWPAMRRASRPSWAARRPSLCRRWRRVRTLLYPIPMRTPPPPPAASRRDSVRARCESQAEGRRAEGATFQIAGMLVHGWRAPLAPACPDGALPLSTRRCTGCAPLFFPAAHGRTAVSHAGFFLFFLFFGKPLVHQLARRGRARAVQQAAAPSAHPRPCVPSASAGLAPCRRARAARSAPGAARRREAADGAAGCSSARRGRRGPARAGRRGRLRAL